MSATREAALRYAELGIPVFPIWWMQDGACACGKACDSLGKHPITASGFKDATLSADTVRRWWRRYPHANVAGVCGKESGIIVLDVDPRHGGNESLAQLEADHGPLPEGPRARTGGGGWHLLFQHPGGHVPKATGFRPGLDLQGDDSYVLLPPSGHVSGGIYAWEIPLDGADLPLLPPWLLKAVTRPSRRKTAHGEVDPIPEGRRNVTLTSVAGRLRQAGAGEEAILTQLRVENVRRCEPPLAEAELMAIARSVARYPVARRGEETPEAARERFERDPRRRVTERGSP